MVAGGSAPIRTAVPALRAVIAGYRTLVQTVDASGAQVVLVSCSRSRSIARRIHDETDRSSASAASRILASACITNGCCVEVSGDVRRRCQYVRLPWRATASLATVVRWFGPDDRTGSGNVPVELAAACLLCELAQSKLQPSPLDRHNRGNAAAHHRRTRALRAANANAVAAAHQRNSVRSVSVPAHDASCWRQSASTMRHGCARRPAGKS